MPGIDVDFMSHRLAIDPPVKVVAQRKWKITEGKKQIIQDETNKLLAVGFIKEIK